jgi:peptidoglycan/xylan/chitin deacetylase (PgdA/CDA1 family)
MIVYHSTKAGWVMSRRQVLASAMIRTGLLNLIEHLPLRPHLVVINHHRIGDAQACTFDRGVFSATAAGLEQQILELRRRGYALLSVEESLELLQKRQSIRHKAALLTFDDGYKDNYDNAFPVLSKHKVPAMFFLVPSYVGTSAIPWWDQIAYSVRHTKRSAFTLRYPSEISIDCSDTEVAIRQVLRHFKRADNILQEKFLASLEEETGVSIASEERRFLSWEEAREMQADGMDFGSHTVTHRILSQLSREEQAEELSRSREEIAVRLGCEIYALAYPVGGPDCFTDDTLALAAEAGYKIAFTFTGNASSLSAANLFAISRASMPTQLPAFRAEVAYLSLLGKMPY